MRSVLGYIVSTESPQWLEKGVEKAGCFQPLHPLFRQKPLAFGRGSFLTADVYTL